MEEHKLQVFGKKGLKKIVGTKKNAANWQFRILHNNDVIYAGHIGDQN
jgi:hypothetical protein